MWSLAAASVGMVLPTRLSLPFKALHAIIKKLKKERGSKYDWIHAYPGEWHELKPTSEVQRDLLWNGGLQPFASACGHKGELKQWQTE